jgi:hypothetical protein
MPNKLFLAQQMNAALRLLAQNLTLTDSEKMEIADLYPEWQPEHVKYTVGKIVKYGVNSHGDAQLYTVITEHTSQSNWTPDKTPSLFKPIGFTDEGVPIWTQPLGYDDAYDVGDKVEHPQGSGVIWICVQGNASGASGMRNTFEPGVWGWEKV